MKMYEKIHKCRILHNKTIWINRTYAVVCVCVCVHTAHLSPFIFPLVVYVRFVECLFVSGHRLFVLYLWNCVGWLQNSWYDGDDDDDYANDDGGRGFCFVWSGDGTDNVGQHQTDSFEKYQRFDNTRKKILIKPAITMVINKLKNKLIWNIIHFWRFLLHQNKKNKYATKCKQKNK